MTLFAFGYVIFESSQRKIDVLMMLGSSVLGFCFDSVLISLGVFSLPHTTSFSPFWLVSMWTGFSTAFSMGLHQIQKIPWFLIIIIAALGGLLSYRTGASFGGIVLNDDLYFSSISIMLEWAIAFPLLLMMYTKLQGLKSLEEI